MTESLVAQCPHCYTRFRVTPEQLATASGDVRCGVCLEVFNAVNQGAPLAAPLTPTESHDELDLSHLELDAELARLGALEERRRPSAPRREAAPEPTPVVGLAAQREVEEPVELPPLPLEPTPPAPNAAVEPAHTPMAAPADLTIVAPVQRPARPPAKAPARERHEPDLGVVEANADERPEPRLDGLASWSEADAEPSHPAKPDATVAPVPRPARSEPQWQDDPLVDLHDDPLRLEDASPRPRWGRRLLWALACLLALGGLLGQYVYYHFDELARQDGYRPLFVQACASLGCKVPSRVDVQQIRSSNLVVRSHPQFSGALRVDAILYNRASFPQPFPLLELRFADLNGQLLASRRFKPAEYLSGELQGQDEMPPQTPIHIALDILDPGPRAVNYSLSFFSPE